jgi:lysyl endopeptidase
MTVTPQITGQGVGSAYIGNELAAWIDFNNDGIFSNPGERVFYHNVTNATTAANFTQSINIPTTAATGTVKMRVRISYNGTQGGEGPINPCGTTEYGEVEDYNVNIQPASTSGIEEEGIFSEVLVYPNPFSNELVIDLGSIQGENVAIEIYDLTGKLLTSRNSNMEPLVQFDMTSFAKGVYQVRLMNGTDKTVRRVIKL